MPSPVPTYHPESSWRRGLRHALRLRGFERVDFTYDTGDTGIYQERWAAKEALTEIIINWGPRGGLSGEAKPEDDLVSPTLVQQLGFDLKQSAASTRTGTSGIDYKRQAAILLHRGWTLLHPPPTSKARRYRP